MIRRIIKYLTLTYILAAIFSAEARANTITAADCNASSVQSAINSAVGGDTVIIPSGTCIWTSGVTISGKGIKLQGSGSGRVIGVSVTSSAVSIGTGTKTFSGVIAATVNGVLSSAQPIVTPGQTLIIYENGFLANFMQGTATSLTGGVLTMNITSAGGTCGTAGPPNTMNSNCKRWLITTLPSTRLINNSSSYMVTITEDSTVHTTVTGIQFAKGTSTAPATIYINRNNSGGRAVLIHDNFFQPNAEGIDSDTNRGVIWNNSFVYSPMSVGQFSAIRIKDPANTTLSTSWSTPSTMGMADTTGENNLYFETNDMHAVDGGTDWDDNSRAVFRYNFLNNATASSHGADTSYIGARHLEYYNNVGIFQAYSDGTTANLQRWLFMRGGTFAFHDNTLPVISSVDWGAKTDIDMTVMTLRRQDTLSCWGAGFSTPGQYYPAPRQVGFGYVTGKGTVTYPPLGYNNSSQTTHTGGYTGGVYAGDSEPVYIWNNNRTMNLATSNYPIGQGGSTCPTSPTPDSSSVYLQAGRDYFNNGTAKPGYAPYTYPHPLTLGSVSGTPPAPPTGLTAIVN